ncbi:hypothetical protein EDB83DRAFT_2364219 [Lactarius deliciosus]|nr:hypothetical protein EDB83DRAFT_2475410 [Lactarius deliciosus]KAH9071496.1 hypothetical protein EDB83DRAFT_2364219 [Lactarius deliciosus]
MLPLIVHVLSCALSRLSQACSQVVTHILYCSHSFPKTKLRSLAPLRQYLLTSWAVVFFGKVRYLLLGCNSVPIDRWPRHRTHLADFQVLELIWIPVLSLENRSLLCHVHSSA